MNLFLQAVSGDCDIMAPTASSLGLPAIDRNPHPESKMLSLTQGFLKKDLAVLDTKVATDDEVRPA